jgi:hypothetical protein
MRRVNAPWLWVRVRGWRWPLVLDLKGRLVETQPAAAGTHRPRAASTRASPPGKGG